MSTSLVMSSVAALVAGLGLLPGGAHAERFEFVAFTPPPGWTAQQLSEGRAYVRSGGIGAVTFYASRSDASPARQAFAAMWRERVDAIVPGPTPEPQLHRDGDFTLAVGARQVRAQDATIAVALVAVSGRGRSLGIVGVAGAGEPQREMTAFLDSLTLAPAASSAPAAPAADASGEIEVAFDPPPGYVARRDGGNVVLAPAAPERTPCSYGIAAPRRSSGALEADAQAALVEAVLPGWQRHGEWSNAARGNAAAGWPYFRAQSDFSRNVAGKRDNVTAMALVFPAERGRVHVVWGIGNPARCSLDDASFARLFHSLRPRGWTADGGQALLRDLQGIWRNSERYGMSQWLFGADGRYQRGLATATRLGLDERSSAAVERGRYELREGALVLMPDMRGREGARYRVRVYEEFLYVKGRWTRAMSLLNEGAGNEVRYDWVEPGAR